MSTQGQVSAVVLNYDGRSLLEVILPSITAQTYPHVRTIVVDNGSRDDSLVYLTETWPEVEVVPIPANVGVAAALNRGVAAADGEFVALLNNDLELEHNWVERLVDGLDRHPEAASVACKLLRYRERDVLDGVGDLLTRSLIARPRGSGERDEGQYESEEEVFAPTAGAALYRSEALSEVGGFDESFYAYFEDVDWGLRAQLRGFKCWYVPTAVAYHMGSATTGGVTNPFYWSLHRRNRIGVIVKDLPLRVLAENAAPILREQAGDLVHSVRHRTALLHLRAWAGALRLLPRWLAARRRIQRHRTVSIERISGLLEEVS